MSTIAIVGAGTAGCVVARRIVDALRGTATSVRVVVIERGVSNSRHDEQNFMLSLESDSDAVTRLDAIVSKSTEDVMYPYVQGRCIGGGGAVNGMVVSPLYGDDFAVWRDHYGCTGWELDQVLTSLDHLLPSTPLSRSSVGRVGEAVIATGGEAASLLWNGSRVSGHTLIAGEVSRGEIEILQADATGIVIDHGRVRGVLTINGVVEADIVVMAAGAVMTPLLLKESGLSHPSLGRRAQDHPSLFFTVARPEAFGGGINATALHSMGDTQVIAYESANPASAMLGGLSLSLLRVKSRGHILGSLRAPRLFLNLLDHDDDKMLMRDAVRSFTTHHVPVIEKECGAVFCDDQGTPAEVLASLSDSELNEWLASHVVPHSHISGTCAMGSGEHAVVSPRGQVRPVQGLYVADASVFPQLPRSNTNMVVAAVAAQIATFLVEDLV
jgi:5-(hydroxymethyl)furfural/furfural oxidase